MSSVKNSTAWKLLERHCEKTRNLHIRDLFQDERGRFEALSMQSGDIFVDFSRNRVTRETIELLLALAREAEIEKWRDRLFAGELLSASEARPVLHLGLRLRSRSAESHAGADSPDPALAPARMYEFAQEIRDGSRTGYSGKPLRHVVSIGMGGPYRCNAMACHALARFSRPGLDLRFLSGDGAWEADSMLRNLDIEQTLFIVLSKSFTTSETLLNAEYVKAEVNAYYGDKESWRDHFAAVSAVEFRMEDFGIGADCRFLIPEGIGGRYSLWSAMALPLLIAIGREQFEQLLAGAAAMDAHFFEQPAASNLPVLLGMIGLWYASFYGAGSRVVLVYDAALRHLPAYLQQLEMESNGKRVNRDGADCEYLTAPVVWGGSGLDGQHAFYQLLYQGTQLVPADFIISAQTRTAVPEYDEFVYANFFAQPHALMFGKDGPDPHKRSPGNQPSNSIILREISPYTLGALLALYEHRSFVQAMVWGINPFDQWGVELGKHLAARFVPRIHDRSGNMPDPATAGIFDKYLEWKDGSES